jgi:hypothetical protein
MKFEPKIPSGIDLTWWFIIMFANTIHLKL